VSVNGKDMTEKNLGDYRLYSTYIFKEADEVSFDALSVGDYKVEVAKDILKDVAALMQIAKHIRSKLEVVYKNRDDWEHRTQTYIYVGDKRIPVDHVCAEVNGLQFRMDFVNWGTFVKSRGEGKWSWSLVRVRHKAWRIFTSRIRRAALGLRR
jgi:hypothetical protein